MNKKFLRWYTTKWATAISTEAMPIIEKALSTGEIAGRDLLRAKTLIGKITDCAYTHYNKHLRKGPQFDLSRFVGDHESIEYKIASAFSYRVYYLDVRPEQVKGEFSKLLKRAKDEHQIAAIKTLIEICDDMIPVVEIMNKLKAMREEDKKNPYKAKLADIKICREIHELLVKITKDTHDENLKEQEKFLHGVVDHFLKERKPTESLYDFFKGSPYYVVLGRWLKKPEGIYTPRNEPFKYKKVPDYTKLVKAEALRIVEDMEAKFIFKNIHKLSPIVEKRGDFKAAKLIKVGFSNGKLVGDIEVAFDNAKFRVQNEVVWSTSVLGRPFTRYPTTFHDVEVGAKGSCRVQAFKFKPEEWMNEVFAKKGSA